MLNKTTRPALLTMLGSLVAFVAAMAWGALFGFPEPDASPEMAARLQFHASLSGWFMLLAVIVFLASFVAFVRRWLHARKHPIS
jgi:hypothetical protein